MTRTTRQITWPSAERNTPAGRVEVMSWKHDDVAIDLELFRSDKFHGLDNEGFRPFVIKVDGVEVWSFVKSGIKPYAELQWLENEPCPLIVGMNPRYVLSILPTQDFETAQSVNVAGANRLIGGSSVERLLDLKIAVAEKLGLEPDFNKEEIRILSDRAAEERRNQIKMVVAVTDENDEKKARRIAAKQSFIQQLLTRAIIVTYTASGDTRRGLPVLESELERLPVERYYVVVDKLGGDPSQCFFLNEKRQKFGQCQVFGTKPEPKMAPTAATVQAECFIKVKLGGERMEIPLYKNTADLATVRKSFKRPLVVAVREFSQGQPTGRARIVKASEEETTDRGVITLMKEAVAA